MDETEGYRPKADDIRKTVGSLSGAEALLIAQQYLRSGDIVSARATMEASQEPDLATFEVCLAAMWMGKKDLDRATGHVRKALEINPDCLPAQSLKAHLDEGAGRRDDAVAGMKKLVEQFPDYPWAMPTLAGWVMPGAYYRDVLQFAHRALQPKRYLEIGVDTGATLAFAAQSQRAIGVDPRPSLQVQPPPCAKVFELESDAFFEQESKDSVFDGQPADLVFIDGMHWFEYALRDFIHAEQWAHENTTVILHDALVITEASTARERQSRFWLGDVFRTVMALLGERKDLRIYAIPTPPSGLIVVRGLDPSSRHLADHLDEIIKRYERARPYRYPDECPPGLTVVSNDEAGYRKAFER